MSPELEQRIERVKKTGLSSDKIWTYFKSTSEEVKRVLATGLDESKVRLYFGLPYSQPEQHQVSFVSPTTSPSSSLKFVSPGIAEESQQGTPIASTITVQPPPPSPEDILPKTQLNPNVDIALSNLIGKAASSFAKEFIQGDIEPFPETPEEKQRQEILAQYPGAQTASFAYPMAEMFNPYKNPRLASFGEGLLGQKSIGGLDVSEKAPWSNAAGQIGGSIGRMMLAGDIIGPLPGLLGDMITRGSIFGGERAFKELGKTAFKTGEEPNYLGIPMDFLYGSAISTIQPFSDNIVKIIAATGTKAAFSSAETYINNGQLSPKDIVPIATSAAIAGLFQVARNRHIPRGIQESVKFQAEERALQDETEKDIIARYSQSPEMQKVAVESMQNMNTIVNKLGLNKEDVIKEFGWKEISKHILPSHFSFLTTADKIEYYKMFHDAVLKTGDFEQALTSLDPWLNSRTLDDTSISKFAHVLQRMDYTPVSKLETGIKYEGEKVPFQEFLSKQGIEDIPLREMKVNLDEDGLKNLKNGLKQIEESALKISHKNLSPRNQRALEEIMDVFGQKSGVTIEPGTINNLLELRSFLDEMHLIHNMTDDRLDLVKMFHDDLTPSQIQDVVDLAKEVKHWGIMENKLQSLQGNITQQELLSQFQHQVEIRKTEEAKWLKPLGGVGTEPKIKFLKHPGQAIDKWMYKSWLNPHYLWAQADGFAPDGPFQRFFLNKGAQTLGGYYLDLASNQFPFREKIKQSGIDLNKWFHETVKIPGYEPVERQEILGALSMDDDHKLTRFIEGNYKGDKAAAEAALLAYRNAATSEDYALWGLIKEQYDSMKPIADEVSRIQLGHGIADNPNWSPAVTPHTEVRNTLKQDLEDSFPKHPFSSIGQAHPQLEKGHLLERTPRARLPISLRELDNYFQYEKQLFYLKNFGPVLQDWDKILNNPELAEGIKQKCGINSYQAMVNWVRSLDDYRNGTGDMDGIPKLIDHLTRAGVIARMGFSGTSALRAMVQGYSLAGVDFPIDKFWGIMRQCINKEYWEELEKNVNYIAPFLPYRNAEAELSRIQPGGQLPVEEQFRDIMKRLPQEFSKKDITQFLRDLQTASMAMYTYTEKRMTYSLTWLAYQSFLDRHPGEFDAAKRYAVSNLIKFRPSTETMFSAPMFTGGPDKNRAQRILLKVFYPFLREVSLRPNVAMELIGQYKNDIIDEAELAKAFSFLTLGALTIGMLGKGRSPIDVPEGNIQWKDLKSTAVDLPTRGIPFVDIAAQSLTGTRTPFQIARSVQVLNAAGELYGTYKGFKNLKIGDIAKHGVAAGANIIGFPYYQPEKIWKGVLEMDRSGTIDPRLLFYSKQTLQRK